MKETESLLHNSFEVECLKRYLIQNPKDANRLAVAHFSDYLEVVHEYSKLEQKLKSPSPIINKIYTRIQSDYKDLLEQFTKREKENARLRQENARLRQENQNFRQENQDLMQLIDALTDDESPLPDFIGQIFEL